MPLLGDGSGPVQIASTTPSGSPTLEKVPGKRVLKTINTGIDRGGRYQLFQQVVDSDTDGLPDAWENHYLLGLGFDGTGNPDGDAYDNAAEWQNGTDPGTADP